MDLLIEAINMANLTWKADVCKLQKNHHMYDAGKCDQNLVQIKDSDNTATEAMEYAGQLSEAEQ
jgi:hypothetical protein